MWGGGGWGEGRGEGWGGKDENGWSGAAVGVEVMKMFGRSYEALGLGCLLVAAGWAGGQELCPELGGNPILLTPGTASCMVDPLGDATITMNEASLIQWTQFNVGAGKTLNFDFLATATNRTVVNFTTGTGSNTIAGTLLSNGRVVLVTPGQRLDVAGAIQAESFLGSTIAADDYNQLLNNQPTSFGTTGPGGRLVRVRPGAEVQATNGDVVLAGSEVSVSGGAMLMAPAGAVRTVAAGSFNLANTGLERIVPGGGSAPANVVNNGHIRAAQVEMKATTEISNGGLVETNGGVGKIFMRVGPGGTVINSGTGMLNGILEVTGTFDDVGVVLDPDDGDAATTVKSAVSRFPAVRRPGEKPGRETVVVDTGGVAASVDNSRERTKRRNENVAVNRSGLARKSGFFGLRGGSGKKGE